ncbi:acyl-CoA dehydrogenase [Nocardia sp. NRRL S-836]|nr:acyl-CoA dehydrogenase [Nocardia sp. NRRL S-836]
MGGRGLVADSVVNPALEKVLAVTAEHAGRCDAEAAFPVEALEALRDSGLLALPVAGSVRDVVDVTLRLGREDMSVAMIYAMHCQQAFALVRHAPALVDRIRSGRVYLASVTTEKGKGGHLLSSESTVDWVDGSLRIDRDAPIVTGGVHADAFLVTVLAPDATSPTQVSLVYADRSQLDVVEVLGGWDPLGMRATHSVPMRLAGTVPAAQVVGEPGGFRDVVATTFGPLAHLGWAAAWLGAASGAFSRVLGLVRGSRQFDPSSELLLTRIAQVRGRLEVVHALLRHTLDADFSTGAGQMLVNTLKVRAASECFAAVDELVELVGLRHGYLRSSDLALERTFRDLRSASLNYSNDRLLLANGALALLDRQVRLA